MSYGMLEDELITLFHAGAPDFEAAEALIQQGADLNKMGSADDENILSKIIMGYWWSEFGNKDIQECDDCERDTCDSCEYRPLLNPNLGESMCNIIRFFLEHGFDVSKNQGCYGAQCLYALTLSTYDRYIIEATKILLNAGAKNRTTSLTQEDDDMTPWSFMATEGSCQSTCSHDYALGNIYDAVYEIYQAVEDGRPYNGIDSYEAAIGKKIQKVLAESSDNQGVFYPMDLPEFKKENCFNKTLYFVYEGGGLILNQYAELWTDTYLPNKAFVDVSAQFQGIVGSTLQRITHDHKLVVRASSHYGQPIITLEMDSGCKAKFSINFGEVKEDERAAYFELLR